MTLLGHWTRQIAFSSVAAMALAAGTAAQANSHDDSFTIAVLPDTQNYIDYTHQKVEGFPFDASQQFLEQMEYVALLQTLTRFPRLGSCTVKVLSLIHI